MSNMSQNEFVVSFMSFEHRHLGSQKLLIIVLVSGNPKPTDFFFLSFYPIHQENI